MPMHPFKTYSLELLHYRLTDGGPPSSPSEACDTGKTLRRMAGMLEKSGRRKLALLGYGSGALPQALSEVIGRGAGVLGETRATVLSLDPSNVQANIPHWWTDDGPCQILADTSAWALVLLLAAHGFDAQGTLMMLNPELADGPERARLVALQRTLLSATVYPLPISPSPSERLVPPAPDLSVAAILRPEEPGLGEFFGQIPAWVREVCVVWDADEPPAHPAMAQIPVSVPLLGAAHRLELDFSAQRNRMLDLCGGQWVLYLDGDEVLPPEVWESLPALMRGEGLGGAHNPDFWFLPRRNLSGSGDTFHMGWGLWPDLQLRLFRRCPGLRFRRRVHEQLTGVKGPGGILVNGPIDHLSRVRKSDDDIRRKLDLFSRASGADGNHERQPVPGAVIHRLNPDHPSLPLASLPALAPARGLLRLLLPVNPAP